MYKAVIFDYGGVLHDENSATMLAIQRALQVSDSQLRSIWKLYVWAASVLES